MQIQMRFVIIIPLLAAWTAGAIHAQITSNPMERMSPPSVPEQPVPILTDDELVRLLAACKGQSLENRRDEAVIRMFIDTG